MADVFVIRYNTSEGVVNRGCKYLVEKQIGERRERNVHSLGFYYEYVFYDYEASCTEYVGTPTIWY